MARGGSLPRRLRPSPSCRLNLLQEVLRVTSEAVRIGVIGAGWWAVTNHIPALLANPAVELVGICGLEPEQLRRVQDRFNIPFATQSYAELLAHGELHGVVVSSPHTLHYEHARAGLKRGCHVLVEKPLATTARDARDLVRLERDTARTIVVRSEGDTSEIPSRPHLACRPFPGNRKLS